MRLATWLGFAAVLIVPSVTRGNAPCGDLARVNSRICGQVVDYTASHGWDRRLFSESLQQKRDMYVYLPPGYDSNKKYPIAIYLHGILQDEGGFLTSVVVPLDQAISRGCLPPLIVVAPDGSLDGCGSRYAAGSFFINSQAGNFQDFIVKDVWNFMTTNYSIRPEPEAHVLVGVSMGGLGAYNIAMKHRDRFKIVIGIMPVLNLRWVDLCGNYLANFNVCNWGWRNCADDPCEVVGSFFHGLVKIRVQDVIYPIFGTGPEGIFKVSEENPIEMVDRLKLKNGELDMYVGYGGRDEFNLDAQAESFLYFTQARGIQTTVFYLPRGTHSEATALQMLPNAVPWLAERLRAYGVDQPLAAPAKP